MSLLSSSSLHSEEALSSETTVKCDLIALTWFLFQHHVFILPDPAGTKTPILSTWSNRLCATTRTLRVRHASFLWPQTTCYRRPRAESSLISCRQKLAHRIAGERCNYPALLEETFGQRHKAAPPWSTTVVDRGATEVWGRGSMVKLTNPISPFLCTYRGSAWGLKPYFLYYCCPGVWQMI